MVEHYRYPGKATYKTELIRFIERHMNSKGFDTETEANYVPFVLELLDKCDKTKETSLVTCKPRKITDKVAKSTVRIEINTEGKDLLVDVGDFKNTLVYWMALGHAVLNPFGMVPSVALAGKSAKDILYAGHIADEIDEYMKCRK